MTIKFSERDILLGMISDKSFYGTPEEFRTLLMDFGHDREAVQKMSNRINGVSYYDENLQRKKNILVDYYAGKGNFAKFKTTRVVENDVFQELLDTVKEMTKRLDACKCATAPVKAGSPRPAA